MRSNACALLIVFGCVSGCSRVTPEQQIVEDAAAALGGRARVLAAKTLSIEGEGTQGNLGQDMTPEATSQTFTVNQYRRVIDLTSGRARTELTRTPNFTYFRGQEPQKLTPDERPADLFHHPLAIVRAALDPAAKISNHRSISNETAVAVTTANGLNFTLAVDNTTKLPTRVVSMTDNPVLGDVAIETTFADYQDVNGLKLPARLTTTTDRFASASIQVTKQTMDAAVGDIPPPKPAATPPAAAVTVEELAKGVWLLAGQSHHSVAVEFTDHLVLIEAPSETRTLAVIAKARELRPGKAVTHVVNTHHHFDHSGGIRAAVSEGLTVVTHKANASLFNDLVGRSRTIAPDALTKNQKPLKIATVDDELVLKDGAMTMNLYHIAGNPHGDTLLMAYLPRERLLVEADAYSPGGALQPYAANLLENIRKRHLRVDRIVPIHGTVVPFADLVKAVQPAATNEN